MKYDNWKGREKSGLLHTYLRQVQRPQNKIVIFNTKNICREAEVILADEKKEKKNVLTKSRIFSWIDVAKIPCKIYEWELSLCYIKR